MKILISKEPVVTGCGPHVEQYRKDLQAIAGTWQEVETEHLFCDQFNIKKLRVHCRHVEAIRGDVREGLYKCAYTGKQSYNPSDIEELSRMQMQRVQANKDVFFMEREPSRFIEPPTVGYAIINAMQRYKVHGTTLLHAANMSKYTPVLRQLRRNEFNARLLLAMADFVPAPVFLGLLKIPQHYRAEELGYNGMFATRKNVADVWDYTLAGPEGSRAFASTVLGVGVNTLGHMLNLTDED